MSLEFHIQNNAQVGVRNNSKSRWRFICTGVVTATSFVGDGSNQLVLHLGKRKNRILDVAGIATFRDDIMVGVTISPIY